MNPYDKTQLQKTFELNNTQYQYFSIDDVVGRNYPKTLRIVVENLIRRLDEKEVTSSHLQQLAAWNPKEYKQVEISFQPSRVIMQDFTGVPAIADLAAMRDATHNKSGDINRINPLRPADLVIDHSVMIDKYGSADALDLNTQKEFERNAERYRFLKWGQQSFSNLRIVPPGKGIIHQVNLEYLAPVVFNENQVCFPDSVVGTDSHTTMINGLGVLGWGVGGIEAEAAMLGQAIAMLVPKVVGVRLEGQLQPGVTATDLVLTITQILREHGVVEKFVEFYGPAVKSLSLADRATIANMAPEYGATCGFFAIDDETLSYLSLTGKSEEQVALIEKYAQINGLFAREDEHLEFNEHVVVNLSQVVPSLAGPKRPQDKIALSAVAESFKETQALGATGQKQQIGETEVYLEDGAVVIAAITSCTNTSNPGVMVAAGLLAKKAREKGLASKPWVKTSLAPGSQVVTEYLKKSGLLPCLEELGFFVAGYGCTTCIGNSGPLDSEIASAIEAGKLNVASVLSGNRNFEGRVHPQAKLNYLASPPLVVAYALLGRVDKDIMQDPLGHDAVGNPVYLKDIWPSKEEVDACLKTCVTREEFQKVYKDIFEGTEAWKKVSVAESLLYSWDDSSYIQKPPFLDMPQSVDDQITDAAVLCVLGDSVTTDHISPAGSFKDATPAGQYLLERNISPEHFNSYGSRRGNHEIMVRGTFANIRLRNKMVEKDGGYTLYLPKSRHQRIQETSIYDAAMKYQENNQPVIVIAGKEYGTGSSRDWAAKGPKLLGVQAVIAESFERIHRTNLVGMGILPLQFQDNENANSLGITGHELFTISGIAGGESKQVEVKVTRRDGSGSFVFTALVRLNSPQEVSYFQKGGILNYVLESLAS